MSYSIFIKTWKNDIKWLPYVIKSIHKYGKDYDEVIIASDRSCLMDVKSVTPVWCRLIDVDDWDNGYIQQQWVKLNADTIVKSQYTLFVDSDCIFHTPFSSESFIREDKPVLLRTKYGNLEGAEVWKGITSAFVGFDVEYEYMRRLPWMYKNSSLTNFKNKYPHTLDHLSRLTTRDFSEFNALGAYIDRYENDQYYIADTDVWIPDSVARQYWSWGGITTDIQTEINKFIAGGVH
jgi:hypothetical protein